MGKPQHFTKQSMKREAVSHLRRMQKRYAIIKSFYIQKSLVMPHKAPFLIRIHK